MGKRKYPQDSDQNTVEKKQHLDESKNASFVGLFNSPDLSTTLGLRNGRYPNFEKLQKRFQPKVLVLTAVFRGRISRRIQW